MQATTSKQIPGLDGLRALSVSLVIYLHVPNKAAALNLLPGWPGVDVFFVISGFLITSLLLREEARNQQIDLYAFYVRRFFRIIPLYMLLLLVYTLDARRDPLRWAQMLHSLPYQLTFMNDLIAVRADMTGDFSGINRAPFGATWSLGIEEKFYLVWPFIFFVLLARKQWRILAIPALLALAALLPFRMFRSYYALLLGCSLAIGLAGPLAQSLRKWLERIPVAVLALASVATLLLVDLDERLIFLFSLVAMLTIGHVVSFDSWLRRGLDSRFLAYMGSRSYGMYMVQAIVLSLLEHVIKATTIPTQLLLVVTGILGSLAVAEVLYRLVEHPCREYGIRLLAKRRKAAAG